MRQLLVPALLAALASAGCGEDPAKDVAKAPVSPAKPVEPTGTLATSNPKAADAPAAPTLAPPASAAADKAAGLDVLVIEPATSKIEFIGSKKVGGAHPGGFKAFRGVVDLVPGKPEVAKFDVDIDTTSIFSDDEKLTGHLKNKDFFEVETYPKAKFVTTEIKPGGTKGATHTLVGNLTLHGQTKSIEIPATIKVDGGTVTLASEFALDKSLFGMTFSGGGMIRDDVVVKLDIKAAKKS